MLIHFLITNTYNKGGIIHYIFKGVTGRTFPNDYELQSSEMVFTIANIAGPDEMPHIAAFHLGLHCLPKYLFRGFQYTKGLERNLAYSL